MTAIELKNITVKRGARYIIKDINLVIKDGSITGLIGHSGSGKTTLLRVIAGFENNNVGKVIIYGLDMTSVEPANRGVGYIFQNYTLFPHLSVFENIAFGLNVRKIPKDEIKKRVNHVTGFLNIQNLLAKFPVQLSGGEQQRVAIARSIILEPKILLFDESFSSLDYNLKIELLGQLKRINKEMGTTILYVTHDQTDCFGLCDRIIVVEQGKIIEENQTNNLLNAPNTKQAANFVGLYQVLTKHIVANINSNGYKFASEKIYYIKKNKFSLIDSNSYDLSIVGTILEVINQGLYFLIRMNIEKSATIEFISDNNDLLKQGSKITLFFSSKDLIIYRHEEADN